MMWGKRTPNNAGSEEEKLSIDSLVGEGSCSPLLHHRHQARRVERRSQTDSRKDCSDSQAQKALGESARRESPYSPVSGPAEAVQRLKNDTISNMKHTALLDAMNGFTGGESADGGIVGTSSFERGLLFLFISKGFEAINDNWSRFNSWSRRRSWRH